MVYVISDNCGFVKIGIAEKIGTRLRSLQTANARQLTCVKAFDTTKCRYDDKALEQSLHAKYYKHRVHTANVKQTEWFTDDILEDLLTMTPQDLDKAVDDCFVNTCQQSMWNKKKKSTMPPIIYNAGDCIDYVKSCKEKFYEYGLSAYFE